ncbi:cholesterol 7-desaturase nvd-like isoform X1 [Daphnia carinata]|uniref:cholesterol 7-desaturase nvd-like isoform X1 n=1 Tax=Daphnia carinata TaxID=120202 RepID=UPI00257CD7DD|nr:cholesterol 7-desaturase nvd-like isoform X1 [Daphnia carinata]
MLFYLQKILLGDMDLFFVFKSEIVGLLVSSAAIVLSVAVCYFLFKPLNRIRDLCDVGYEEQLRLDNYGQSRRQLANEMRRRKKIGEIPPVYPNGWFALCESDDLKNLQVRSVDALGENFAVFRSAEGVAYVLDAYCPHLGAHLGVGSRVVGDCVECPFHGWQFRGEDGQCTSIPYTSGKIPKSARVRSWSCDEANGFIFVWYHAEQENPSWKVPRIPEIVNRKWIYGGRSEYKVNAHIQEIPENGSDVAHLDCLHGPSLLYGSDLNAAQGGKSDNGWVPFLQHHWKLKWEPNSEEKHVATSSLQHELRLFGRLPFLSVDVEAKQMGPGLVCLSFITPFGRCLLFETVTPIEPMIQRVLHRLYMPVSMVGPVAKFFVWVEAVMFERDVAVWNSKTFMNKPILVAEDRGINHYRRWFQQFYSENSPRFTFQENVSSSW